MSLETKSSDLRIFETQEIKAEIAQVPSIEKMILDADDFSKQLSMYSINHGPVDSSLIRDECLFEIFENTSDAYPERPAIIFQNKEYSYKEIDSSANRLGWYLRERGIQTGDKVGLLLENSVDMYVAMLGIMKSGAAYVPIDIGYPEDRVKYILENSEVSLTVTYSSIADFFAINDPILLLDQESDRINRHTCRRLERAETGVTPNDLGYIIYTSGSTGRPKGVQIEHKSVCNLVRATQKIYQIKPEDRVYQGFTVAFDASIEEIWMAFGHGAALIPKTREMQKAGFDFGKLLIEAKVTILSCVPTLMSMITEDIPSLRLIILGGEACPQHLVDKLSKPIRRLINTYGPTEATVIATYSELEPNKKVTIGRPLSNYSVYILNEDGSLASHGEAGELLIGGIGLARGYVGNSDLNQDKFIENPEFKSSKDPKKFNEIYPKRLYRTGDLARFCQGGEIEFLGRIDSQVKIRGFRVELSEIESVINSSRGVLTSVVSVHDSPEGIQKLAAYIVPEDKKESVDLANIYTLMKERLPSYMVPQYIDFIDKLPMLQSGKIDRKSLRLPNKMIIPQKSKNEVKPRTELEDKIAEIWKSVFKMESISIKDHFFNDLSGHSLFAASTISALRKYPEMSFLNFADIYESPTIELLAEKINSYKSNRPNNVEKIKKSFLTSSSISHALCGIGQALCFSLSSLLFSVLLMGGVYLLLWEVLSGTLNVGNIVIISGVLLLLGVGLFPFFILLTIAIKWIVIGRYKPGRYPLWGSYYLRWWFVRAFSLAPISLFEGTPLMPLYLRLMGSKVGKDCYINTNTIQTFDLISIGDKTSIGFDAQLLGYTVEDGCLVLGKVDIGSECYVGTHSILCPDTKMENGSMLLDQSTISEGITIPSGESWSGSPASISEPDEDILAIKTSSIGSSLKRKVAFGIAQFTVASYIFEFITLIASIPVLINMYFLYVSQKIWILAFLPLAATMFVLIMCTEIVFVKKIILGKINPGIYGIYSSFYFRKWMIDRLMAMSLSILHTLYATLYIVPFLRAMGVKIGKKAEVSTVMHISPDLLYMGDETFFADAAMIGTQKVYMNRMMIAESRIGRRSFIGNGSMLPINTTIGDNCLIGVLSVPPKGRITPSGTSWLGMPAMYLHKRDINNSFSDTETYSPSKLLYAKRLTIEFFKVILPITVDCFAVTLMLPILYYMYVDLYFWQSVLLFPLVMIAFLAASLLIVLLAKYVLIGTFKPQAKPLWSKFVWTNELITGLYETMVAPFLSVLVGTPFIAWFLRLFGCKIGKRTFIETTFFTEFDLVKIEDETAINHNATMQTHLFEDRVMKMSYLRIGKCCTVGSEAIVLYDTVMEEGAKLGSLSLLMKGETLPSWTSWEGNPVRTR